jgi:hypothetical protein
MNLGRTGIKILDLRLDARDELYLMIDKYYRSMPKDATGKIDPEARGLAENDIDALRHSYVSAVYVIEFSYETAELLGRLNEFFPRRNEIRSRNMDMCPKGA